MRKLVCDLIPKSKPSFFIPNSFQNLEDVSEIITKLVHKSYKKMVLLIGEVDKSCKNQLFFDFLGMLRNKYLRRDEPSDYTFHSVILAWLHDVKSLKTKNALTIKQGRWNTYDYVYVNTSFLIHKKLHPFSGGKFIGL